jgi:hypothetical protein
VTPVALFLFAFGAAFFAMLAAFGLFLALVAVRLALGERVPAFGLVLGLFLAARGQTRSVDCAAWR